MNRRRALSVSAWIVFAENLPEVFVQRELGDRKWNLLCLNGQLPSQTLAGRDLTHIPSESPSVSPPETFKALVPPHHSKTFAQGSIRSVCADLSPGLDDFQRKTDYDRDLLTTGEG